MHLWEEHSSGARKSGYQSLDPSWDTPPDFSELMFSCKIMISLPCLPHRRVVRNKWDQNSERESPALHSKESVEVMSPQRLGCRKGQVGPRTSLDTERHCPSPPFPLLHAAPECSCYGNTQICVIDPPQICVLTP